MKTIKLHGWLGKRFGRTFELDVASPAEAVRALCSQLPGFQSALAADEPGFRVKVDKDALTESALGYPFSNRETLHIVPVVAGAGGKNGLGQILLGIVILVAAFFTGGTALGAFAIGGTTVTAALTSFGISLVLGGIAQMLFAPPSASSQERPENKPSYAFSGAVNTIQQGGNVPVAYGELRIGSQVISAGLFVEDIAL